MGPAEFTLAIWALLLTPGPTNTLLALSGAQRGVRASLPLIPAELCGYLLVILPLSAGGPLLLTSFPVLATVIKLSAAAWVMYLAMRLWQPVLASRASYDVTARQASCTTLLNPKALIFGLALLPAFREPVFMGRLALFILSVLLIALLWAAAGAAASGRDEGTGHRRQRWIRRAAASWLAMLSIGLAVGAVAH